MPGPVTKPPRDYRVPVPPGSCSFDLAVGGVRLRVEGLPTAFEPFVHEQYAPFALPCDGAPNLTIRCREGSGMGVPLPAEGEMVEIEIDRLSETRFAIHSHWQEGWLDTATGTAELLLLDRTWDRFAMSVENFVRCAFQLLLITRERFLLHTAGVIDGGRVFLFFGPSGAGKSTATHFSAPRPVLSDDMVLIDVSGPQPLACTVPFNMKFDPRERHAGSWPIAGAFRLRQAPEDRLERLPAARAVATVSSSVPYIHELGIPHEGLTALVARLCATVPAYDLYFKKGPGFWRLLSAR